MPGRFVPLLLHHCFAIVSDINECQEGLFHYCCTIVLLLFQTSMNARKVHITVVALLCATMMTEVSTAAALLVISSTLMVSHAQVDMVIYSMLVAR